MRRKENGIDIVKNSEILSQGLKDKDISRYKFRYY